MPPENRAEWQNFIDSADIQPLGTPYGYQLELPFEETALFNARAQRFFDDPRNIRGLIGEISTDAQGQIRQDFDRTVRNAVQAKRGIRNTPKLVQDLTRLTNRPGGGFSEAAGLEDAYSLRQLFGEQPGAYGETPDLASSDPRGTYSTERGYRTRYGSSEPTSELSPAERTAATSPLLRPDVLAADLTFLESPIVLNELYSQTGGGEDSPAALRALETLNRSIRGLSSGAFADPIDLDASRNIDNEGLRRLVTRDNFGILSVANEFPGQFAEGLQNLLSRSDADVNYIYDYLRDVGRLPDQASEPVSDWDTDDDSGYFQGRKKTETDIRDLAETYPEQKDVLSGRYGANERILKQELLDKYGRYIPTDYKKLRLDEIDKFQQFFRELQDPNSEFIARVAPREFQQRGPVETVASAFNIVKDEMLNKTKQLEAANFLGDFLDDLDNKMTDVPVRWAGVGGGEYLNRAELRDLYPRAYEKLDFFSGGEAYVPDDFQPTISETFYSKEGTPYNVKINRDPAYSSLNANDINANVASLLSEKPYAGLYNIDFTINDSYSDARVPEYLKPDIMNFVKNRSREGIPAGAIIRNQPLGNELSRSGGDKGNKRSIWYQQLGLGAETPEGQFGYIDPESGSTVPIQPFKTNISKQGSETYKRSYNLLDPVSPALRQAASAVKNNPYGAAGGAALTLLNDEVANAIAKDDYQAAGVAAAKDILGGAAIEAGLKAGSPVLQRVAPGVAARVIPAVAGAAQYGIPAAVGTGLFTQGRSGSALDTLVNKAAPVVPGLKPNPKTDIGRRTGDAILNEGKYLLRSILQNRVPYLKGRLF